MKNRDCAAMAAECESGKCDYTEYVLNYSYTCVQVCPGDMPYERDNECLVECDNTTEFVNATTL